MQIRHSRGSYEICFASLAEAWANLPDDAVILTDRNVARCHPAPAGRATLVIEPGERSKSLECYGRCLEWLAGKGATRKTCLVAVGGGVVGDLGGFLAASYMRGIPFIQVPTSLLAQVDSSVGGKVGIDLEQGKNLVGAFYPPTNVYVCVDSLNTLPGREFTNGMAEVWKYGFIMDSALVSQLQSRALTASSPEVCEIVERCIRLKAEVVEADEFETTGRRAILNFGHTVGHAIERLTGYGPVLHGEAIAIGMVVEAGLGERLGVSNAGTKEVVQECLAKQGLPTTHPVLKQTDEMLAAMYGDKKSEKGSLGFALLESVGQCKLVRGMAESEVRAALQEA